MIPELDVVAGTVLHAERDHAAPPQQIASDATPRPAARHQLAGDGGGRLSATRSGAGRGGRELDLGGDLGPAGE
jgi:hypothetical protein